MAEIKRSTEDIRQDIAREGENLSRTAHQIGDRIKEKLDWSAYVKDSPYWTLGAAVGLGILASRMMQTRTNTMERIMGSLAEEVRDSLRGVQIGAPGPSLVQASLLGIATKFATDMIKNSNGAASSSGGDTKPQAQAQSKTDQDSTMNPEPSF